MSDASSRPLIFISYAQADEPEQPADGEVKWLSFVLSFLRPAVKGGIFDVWVDRQMKGGANVDTEIEAKLRACDIFVLLVSPSSMASDYIVDREIAIIRERQARGEQIHFYPLLLTPTPRAGLDKVKDKNLRPPGAKPFSGYSAHDRARHMADAANEIAEIAESIAARKETQGKDRDAGRSAASAFEGFRRDSIRHHEEAMADRRLALKQYGQGLCPLVTDGASPVILRERALAELEETAATPAPVRNAGTDGTFIRTAPIVVLGDEGVGKSWLVAQWWLTRHRDLAFVFIPSNRFRSSEIDVAKLLTESFKAMLAHGRRETRAADVHWRGLIESEGFRKAAEGKIIIVVDGLNEAPVADWRGILEELWREAVKLGAFLVVTCRPSYWRGNPDLAHMEWPDPAIFRLHGFSHEELSIVLSLHGRRIEDIPARLLPRLSNPRIFTLAMRLLESVAEEADLGIDRLLFGYWEQRRRERPDLRQLDPGGRAFYQGLARHAELFHKRRLVAARDASTDLDADEVAYSDDDLRQRFAGLQRYRNLSNEEISALVGEIRDGQFFRSDVVAMAPAYRFQSSALGFALGLYLVQEALHILQTSRKGTERETLREHFAALLEPVMAFDQTADQLLAAVTVACLEPSTSPVVRELFIAQFIALQNRPEPLKPEFVGLAVETPQAFFAVIDSLLIATDAERIDRWLVDALRRAYRAGSGLDLFREWIVSPLPRYAQRFRCKPVETVQHAYRREVVAARAVAGSPLAPLARDLLDWALFTALRLEDDARYFDGVVPAPHSGGTPEDMVARLAQSPMTRVIRANDVDPEDVEREIVTLAGDASRGPDGHFARAAALLLAVIASPGATTAAERLWPGVADAIDRPNDAPLPPLYLAVDPSASTSDLHALRASLPVTAGSFIDPRSPRDEVRLVLAARCCANEYLQLAEAGLEALSRGETDPDGFSESFKILDTWAVSSPSIFKNHGDDDRRFVKALLDIACDAAAVNPERRAAREAKNTLDPLDHLLEVLFASRPADRYREFLLAIPWGRLPSGHWPARPHRWRPRLPAGLVETLVAESIVRLQSVAEEDNIAGANLLEAVALHPIEAMTETTVAILAQMFVRDPMGASRQSIVDIAAAAGGSAFAFAIRNAGWTASSEAEPTVATLASDLLCSRLAGLVPLDELSQVVLPSALPAAVEGVADDEVVPLAGLILSAVASGIALSDSASSDPDGPANLEKHGYVYRMLPIEPGGARRLSARAVDAAAACFDLLKQEVMTSPRNSLCESFGTTLVTGMEAPAGSAVTYVEMLIRRRSTPNRALGARIVSAGLAVATGQPAHRQRLLDLLVLSANGDDGLARLATAAHALGPETISILEAHTRSLIASGRTARMAYGLTLAGLLSHLSPALRGLRSGVRYQGYLGRVSENADWIERRNDAAQYWAARRLADGDLAAEHLALSTASRPLASASQVSRDDTGETTTDVLFRHRLLEKSKYDQAGGLFGLPKPPEWLFELQPGHASR